MTRRTGWTGGLVTGVVAAVGAASLLGSGSDRPVAPGEFGAPTAAGVLEATASGSLPTAAPARRQRGDTGALQQTTGADALLNGIEGTPPVACELVVRSLGNRWGSSSVTPRVHPPLAGIASERAVARWAWTDRPAAAEAGVLLAGLESADACVQRVAARLLGLVDDSETVSRIMEMARTRSGSRQLAAIAALAHVSDERAAGTLDALLSDDDPEVRRAVAWALAETEDDGSVIGLIEALRDADPVLRENAAWALGRIESADALGPLEGALRDPTVGVRVNAAWALGQIEDAAAIPALAAVVGGDAEDEVRRTAAWALGRIER